MVFRRSVPGELRAAHRERNLRPRFPKPLRKPSGQGLSSSAVNVLWGFFNLAVAYVLLVWLGELNLHYWWQVVTAGAGALFLSVMMARHFGRFHGGLLKS
jgi:hypothetical protein